MDKEKTELLLSVFYSCLQFFVLYIPYKLTHHGYKYRGYRDDVDDGGGYRHDNDAVYQPKGDGGEVKQLYKPWAVAPKADYRKH